VAAADNHSQSDKGEHGNASQGANYGEQGGGAVVAIRAWCDNYIVVVSVTTRRLRGGQSRDAEWLAEAGRNFPCIMRWG